MSAPTATTPAWLPPRARPGWRDVVWPKEHGSWSLAFEPVALGLLCAPSAAGGLFGLAVAAGFFSRRPLRIAWREPRGARRTAAWCALGACAALALAALAGAMALGGTQWIAWLLPTLACGVVFAIYDLKNDGREEVAEIAGTAAFGLLPAAFAILGGWSPARAAALALLMCGRGLPTVIFVRALVRGRKTLRIELGAARWAAALALAVAIGLAWSGLAPVACIALFALLLARVPVIEMFPHLRAKHLGIIEAIGGVVFVVATALAWRL